MDPELGTVTQIHSLSQLNRIIANYPGVICDFWSPSCPPCMNIKPKFEAAARANQNPNLVFCACNC